MHTTTAALFKFSTQSPLFFPPALPAQVCRQLYAQEGLHGFSRGMGARVATMATGSAVTWMTYESCKRWLGRWQQGQQEGQQQQGQPQQQQPAVSGLEQQLQPLAGQQTQQQGAPR